MDELKGQEDRRNAIMVDDKGRRFRIDLFDNQTGEDLVKCLGSLELAKDMIKSKMAEWNIRKAQSSGILIPRQNGKGPQNVI